IARLLLGGQSPVRSLPFPSPTYLNMKLTQITPDVIQGYVSENIKFIQAQLGHASIQTTLDRYGHLLPEVHN
ncbi:hypothetical protein HKBW3S43_01627, partial [Candidatus Hakubella thermalkaliphila]